MRDRVPVQRVQPATVRVLSSACGVLFSVVTLVAAAALFTIPSLTPVGVVVAVAISASVLSLPVWAAGLLYSLYAAPLGLAKRNEQALLATAGATLGLYLVGFVVVLSQTGLRRTIGDGLYVVATLLLFALSATTLLVEARTDRTAGQS